MFSHNDPPRELHTLRFFGWKRQNDALIVPQSSEHYLERMSLRSLLGTLIAIAMLFAPLGLGSGGAMAMVPVADHHAQMMESGHCDKQPGTGKDSPSDTKTCCVAMCTAIAIEPITPSEPHALASSHNRPSLAQVDHSFLAKLPTPPPRFA